MAGGGEERAAFRAVAKDAEQALPKIAEKHAETVESAADKGTRALAAHAENEAKTAAAMRSHLPKDRTVPSPRAPGVAAGEATASSGSRVADILDGSSARPRTGPFDPAEPQLDSAALSDSPNFDTQLDDELKARGLSRAEHDRLRVSRTNDLTGNQIKEVVEVRNTIRIRDGSILTKVLKKNIADGYLDEDRSLFGGNFDPQRFSGSVARGTDTAGLRTPGSLRDGLALDDKGAGWSPIPDESSSAYQLRFRAPSDLDARTTFGAVDDPKLANQVAEAAGQSSGKSWGDPFTGTGYTEGGIPEWDVKEPTPFSGRAEIWRVDPDGRERMLGYYHNNRWRRLSE